jgi:hypothetical protein
LFFSLSLQTKSALNKQTQQRLLIRLAFKIGYLAEFRDESHAALKYYSEAHTSTSEWRAALAARVRANFALDLAQLDIATAGGNQPPAAIPPPAVATSSSSTASTSSSSTSSSSQSLTELVAIEALRDDEAAALATLAWFLSARCHLSARRPDLAAQLTRREAAAVRLSFAITISFFLLLLNYMWPNIQFVLARATPLPSNREYIGWARLAHQHATFAELLEVSHLGRSFFFVLRFFAFSCTTATLHWTQRRRPI